MVTFSFDRIAEFPLPALDHSNIPEEVAILEQSRRREALFSVQDKSSLNWLSAATEFYFDAGFYAESDQYSNRLENAALEAGNDCFLAKAYFWQVLCAISYQSRSRVVKRLEQLTLLAKRSGDPIILAKRLLAQGLAFEKCNSWESPLSIDDEDDWCNVFLAYKEASELFLIHEEIDLCIMCHVEYALSKISHGEYLTSIHWIERALDLALEHRSWKWTARMLQVAGSAATDQGYRHRVEKTLRTALTWAEFVGDEWGRIECLTAIGRLLMFEIPPLDPEESVTPDRILIEARNAAERASMPWLQHRASHARKFLRRKCGTETDHEKLYDSAEAERLAIKLEFDISRRVNSRLEDGVGDSPDGFLVFNALRNEESVCEDFINEYRNFAAIRILGTAPGYVFLLSEAAENPYLRGLLEPIFNATEKRLTYEDVAEVIDGAERLWFRRRVTPSGDGAVVKLRNVTSERQIEEALKNAAESAMRSERTMAEFLANMSHEIRTPISGVLGLARMLAETNLDETQRTYVKDIIGSGDILLGLVGDVLELSKLEAGFIDIVPEPVLIRDLVTGIAGLYRGQAMERKVEIETAVSPDVPSAVLTDAVRVRQILANLVGNAVKFTVAGTIRIDLATEGSELVFEVSDTGIGIPADRLPAIFDRFEQGGEERSRRQGTGLGLTLSRMLVELMGGSISLQSKTGVGTKFAVRLPLVPASEPAPTGTVEFPTCFEGLRVLLVEDNPVNLVVSRHFIRKFGCDVETASNGAEAVEILGSRQFDVVFMDVRMPVLDGLEATREIRRRERPHECRIPIVALTAGALSEERDRCFEAGMDDYISKPFTAEALQATLAKWLSGR